MLRADKAHLFTRLMHAEDVIELRVIIIDLISLLPTDEEISEEVERELQNIANNPNHF